MNKTVYIFCALWILGYLEVCGQVTYPEIVAQALRFQVQADSMQRVVDAQVLALNTARESEKNGIRKAIRSHEAMTSALQKRANEWFIQAVAFETYALMPVADLYHEFAILPKSPYSAENPAPVDVPVPNGVIYKIQLGVFRNPSAANTFKGLTPLSGEMLDNGAIKYYAGLFSRFADADHALRKVHEYGFKDALIVAFYNQKPINTGRARQLETAN